MTPEEFIKLLLTRVGALVAAIETGERWEISAQTEIANVLQERGSVAREIPYPGIRKSLDFLVRLEGEVILIELKTESGGKGRDRENEKFAGKSLQAAVDEDVAKIQQFDTSDLGDNCVRWVVVIAFTAESKQKIRDDGGYIYAEADGVMVAIRVV